MAIFLFFWAVLPQATTRHPAGPVWSSLALGGVPLLSSSLLLTFLTFILCVLRALIFSVFSFSFYASACSVGLSYHF